MMIRKTQKRLLQNNVYVHARVPRQVRRFCCCNDTDTNKKRGLMRGGHSEEDIQGLMMFTFYCKNFTMPHILNYNKKNIFIVKNVTFIMDVGREKEDLKFKIQFRA